MLVNRPDLSGKLVPRSEGTMMGHPFVDHWKSTNCSGCLTGRDLSITALIRLKIAVLTPIPSAKVKTVTVVKAGFFASVRTL